MEGWKGIIENGKWLNGEDI